ncbi:MAG TPA: hypothetical protein VJJ47_00105 [Candidatus Paceibacterota bacterium]
MADEPKKAPAIEEDREDDRTADKVDLASLIEEDEPIVVDLAATDDAAPDVVATRKVDLDGDDSGWEYGDETEEGTEEESYEDSPDSA